MSISRCVGIIASTAARSVYSRLPYFNPVLKSITAHIYPRIYPGAAAAGSINYRCPYSNHVVKSIAACGYLTGRAFLDAAVRTIKSWIPRMPVFGSFTYVNVEKIEDQEKIERVVYPYLFRVRGKNILPDQKVYLLGTNHRFKEADYPPEVLALIKACDFLLSEFPAQMGLSKDPAEWYLHNHINTDLPILKKLFSIDQEWIGTLLSAYEPVLGKIDMDVLISMLKEKGDEIKADQARWLDRLPLADQTKIQSLLGRYELQLRDLDPLSVVFFLAALNMRTDCHGFNTGEIAILKNFQERNCPIIELEDKSSSLAFPFSARVKAIIGYDLESTLKTVAFELEHQVEKIDEFQQTLQEFHELGEEGATFSVCEGSEDNQQCLKFETLEELRGHTSIIQEADKLHLLRSICHDKIYFNFEEFEQKTLADPGMNWTTIYRHNTWNPKIPSAIKQKKNTSVVCGWGHLA